MPPLLFEWDEAKNQESRRKHGVSFEEARTVFYDENAIEFYDDEHSEWEDRFLLLGGEQSSAGAHGVPLPARGR